MYLMNALRKTVLFVVKAHNEKLLLYLYSHISGQLNHKHPCHRQITRISIRCNSTINSSEKLI